MRVVYAQFNSPVHTPSVAREVATSITEGKDGVGAKVKMILDRSIRTIWIIDNKDTSLVTGVPLENVPEYRLHPEDSKSLFAKLSDTQPQAQQGKR